MKSGKSHCNHGLASEEEGRKEGRKEDVMTSKYLTTLPHVAGGEKRNGPEAKPKLLHLRVLFNCSCHALVPSHSL